MKTLQLFSALGWLFLMVQISMAQEAYTDSSIELVTPTGGEMFKVGNTLKVQWVLHNDANPGGGLLIQISPDEGRNWIRIVDETIKNGDAAFYHDSVGTYVWTIQDSLNYFANIFLHLATNQCLIMIGAPYDEVFVPGQSNTFTISPSNASIKSLSHSGRGINLILGKSDVEIFTIDGRRALQKNMVPLWLNQSGISGARIIRERDNTGYQILSGIMYR
jgi:hypothetical protein